ncbi:DNA-binding protein [Exiguobacterium sp. SH1S21]|uniref:helix-turn-helix domain-containing protein n=1 Tax=Exiguobacterium sp. SH1S21 TaxID=2510953 RepID=UPI00103AC86E|nr:helix-turn-helix domain-containing protein [Exiguobacterium sp. SH1S21]TCI50321.1 DNA-binding protein [Exiguobacterium sp. SH1S21]
MIINEAELKRLIRDAVYEALTNYKVEPESYLSIDEVSELLGLGRSTVIRLIREKGLPILRIGALIRIRRSSLEEWLEKQESVSEVWK